MSFRLSNTLIFLVLLVGLSSVRGAPTPQFMARHDDDASTPASFQRQNALDAQKLNVQFSTIKATDACKGQEMACIGSSFAQCISGKWALTSCAPGTICASLPLITKPGTSISCDFKEEALGRFVSAGVEGGLMGTGAPTPSPENNDPADECTDDGTDDSDDNDGQECEADDDNDGSDDGGDEECDGEEEESTETVSATRPASTATKGTITVTVTATPSPVKAAASFSSSASAAPSATTIKLNRRQLGATFVSPGPPSTSAVVPVATPISTTLPVITTALPSTSTIAVSSSAPTIVTVTVQPSSASSVVISTPTPLGSVGIDPTGVVIGPDGLRTITIVSTVTVGCGATPISSSSSATISPVLPNAPVFTTLSGPASSSLPVPPKSSAAATSSSASSIVSSSSVVATPALPATTLSFSDSPLPTSAPVRVNNNGAGSSTIDLSELLTATV